MGIIDKIADHFGIGKDAVNTTPPSVVDSDQPADDIYKDYDKLRSRVKDAVDVKDHLRWAFERLWFRAILYYLGNQWLTWDARSRRWREKKLRKWVPKPVTNRYASTIESIVSAIQSFKVLPSAWPATDDVEDIAATNVAERAIDIINDEIHVDCVREAVAKWIGLNGDAFVFPYYDRRDATLGKKIIQALRCTACGTDSQPLEVEQAGGSCPNCTSPELIPATDEAGKPVGKEYPVGRMRAEVWSPLQVYLNIDITDMSRQHRFTGMQSYDLETIKQRWPETGKTVTPDTQSATRTAKYFLEAIAYSTEDSGYNLTGAAAKERASVLFHFEMPSEEYPEGLVVIMSSDETILEAGPSPFFEENTESGSKDYYWPLVKFGYSFVPGRLYSKTPAYDLIGKQDQLNRLESLIELAIMKGVHSTWLLPTGSSISNLSGEPAQMVRYTPTATGGHKPEVITQEPFSAIILEWKKQIQEDFEELGGTFDALKGNVPRGVSAGYAIQLLTERSYGRFASVFANWERGWVELYGILLKIFRTYVTEERLHKIKGASGAWEIAKFKGANLKGSVDLKIEGGASRPRSKIAEQALVESLSKLGVVNAQDPDQKFAIADMFGMTHLLGATDEDQRHAAAEWDLIQNFQPQPITDPNTGQPVMNLETGEPMFPQPDENGNVPGLPFFDPIIDNHAVHVMDHVKRAKTDVFKKMEPWKQMYWRNHILSHKMQVMQQMMMQGGPQPGGQKPPQQNQPKPAASKANETSDKTMDTVRQGGNTALGGGGKNQYA